ncbi:MAG TPA: hypothetical protein PLM53_08575 [Spirochaetota bacterium]|nr:hypothetical protein [Spirochaetota bacterium]HPC42184.1 hypothetical protein [Spirochaetota bacterium]HPL16608.1 hypothetical protein [Spirochaetota bacterium]HQF08246.1 hypothetical protein [Spirochaetota bacterium]HQH97139.1 hypothetical protein [Spirochaetota bacterium]
MSGYREESLKVEINPSKRILKAAGAVCGGISTGTEKIRSGYGNGDCLYFDFEHMVFAVADATERFPWASRDLLNRLSESLAKSGAPDSAKGWKEMINTEVYSVQKFQHKTTFSCIAVRSDPEGLSLVISHGGDSVVTVMDSVTGGISHQTGRDMYFAGRSREIADVIEYRVADRNSRVLVSSDGFDDVWRFCIRRSLLGGAREVFERYAVDSICEMIHGILEENRGAFEHDDIGFIILDPFRLERIDGTAVVMGGTRPGEEHRYLTEYASRRNDRWVPGEEWGASAEEFDGAGIRILAHGGKWGSGRKPA